MDLHSLRYNVQNNIFFKSVPIRAEQGIRFMDEMDYNLVGVNVHDMECKACIGIFLSRKYCMAYIRGIAFNRLNRYFQAPTSKCSNDKQFSFK